VPELIQKTLQQVGSVRSYTGLALLCDYGTYRLANLKGSASEPAMYPAVLKNHDLRLCTTLEMADGRLIKWPIDGEQLGIQTGNLETLKGTIQTWVNMIVSELSHRTVKLSVSPNKCVSILTCAQRLFDEDTDIYRKAQTTLDKIGLLIK
jgi:hypothetical protein